MGTTTQTTTVLSQPTVFQHTEGAVKGLGAASQGNTNLSQPPTIQHMGGDGGGLFGASSFGAAGKKSAVSLQNALSALSSANPGDDHRDGQQRLL